MSDIEPKNQREVSIERAAPKRLTVMLYGPSGSGKTYAASSFPRPRFLSDATEQGWDTIQAVAHEHPDWLYDLNWKPEIRKISSMRDMYEELELADKDGKAGLIHTLVIDSLTFYGNACLSVFQKEITANAKAGVDNRQVYGKLAEHLRNIMTKAHGLANGRLNVVWLALNKEPDTENGDGGIFIAGQTKTVSPAACSLWLYLHCFKKGDEFVYEARTRKFGCYPARGRFGDLLPDPIPNANYKEIEAALGMTPFPLVAQKPKVQAPAQPINRMAGAKR